jgi:hypothetical protein
LVEFQGKQHYEAVSFFGGEEGFKGRWRRDQIKREFCRKNDIPLLEIRYDDKDWQEELKDFLDL